MVVEILSESTKAIDREVEFGDYAADGVKEYWIVDAEASIVDAEGSIVERHLLDDDGYGLEIRSGTGQLVRGVIPGLVVSLAAFLDGVNHLETLRSVMGKDES